MPHGQGRLDDGTLYEGGWVDGKKSGFGREVTMSGYYLGFWKTNRWEGQGSEYDHKGELIKEG